METVEHEGLHWPRIIPDQAGPSGKQLSALVARQLGCAGCIFWHRNWWGVGDDWGACKPKSPRSAPPRTTFLEGYDVPDVAGLFPLTAPDEWCGEFEAAPVGPAAEGRRSVVDDRVVPLAAEMEAEGRRRSARRPGRSAGG